MRQHLDALIVLQRIWSAFGAITGIALAILALGADLALAQVNRLGPTQRGIVWLFAGGAAALCAVGAAGLIVCRGLRRRSVAARLAALVLALVDLVFVPFGTALAVYTVWVLLNNDARREFGRPLRGPTPERANGVS
jgi:hypothetical protein